jgi:hypothetical protein
VSLETLIKVGQAHDAVSDGHDDEQNSDDGEGSERLLDSLVILAPFRLVDAHQLEDEVGEGTMIEDNDGDHACLDFATRKPCGSNENTNRDGDRGDGESKLWVIGIGDDDDQLNDEPQEEEEIELEQGDVDLIPVSRLHRKMARAGYCT